MIRFYELKNWLLQELNVKKRLQVICLWSILSLMVITRKHSLEHAAEISGKDKSLFSRFLSKHHGTAVLTLQDLSKRKAKQWSKALKGLKALPWKVALIIDLTSQGRSSLHAQNVKKLNHGKGYFVGHQWTNIIMLVADHIVPLPPIPFYTKKYCREKGLEYKTEHERVLDYLRGLHPELYLDGYKPQDIVVIADSGYDDHRIQKLIREKGWDFVMALKKKRSVKSGTQYLHTRPSKGWSQIEAFFKDFRRLGWETVHLFTSGAKRKRKEFRIRHTTGWLKNVGRIQLVCSEKKKAPHGERKYFACTNLSLKSRLILVTYSLRWKVELFHKAIKMHLGFEHVSASSFDSVVAHVHWVYCAFLLLQDELPGVPSTAKSIQERQHYVMDVINQKEKARLLQRLTQIHGVENMKNELKRALAA